MKLELETKVQMYRIDKKCSQCKDGLMFATGEGVTQWHTRWKHECNNCGHTEWIENKSYPLQVTELIKK